MDQWIIGTGTTDERTYVVHTREPRFVAIVDAGEMLSRDTTAIDEDAGQEVFDQVADKAICVVGWIDPKPDDATVEALLQEAAIVFDIHLAGATSQ